jgi:hypothetical protein
MNTRSSKEYRYIFTTTWKQASTSHLFSRLTDNASGKLLIIFILFYLFVLPTSFSRIPKTHNRTSLQVWHANVLYFCSFCKPTFSGATSEWDALYNLPRSWFVYGAKLWYVFRKTGLPAKNQSDYLKYLNSSGMYKYAVTLGKSMHYGVFDVFMCAGWTQMSSVDGGLSVRDATDGTCSVCALYIQSLLVNIQSCGIEWEAFFCGCISLYLVRR